MSMLTRMKWYHSLLIIWLCLLQIGIAKEPLKENPEHVVTVTSPYNTNDSEDNWMITLNLKNLSNSEWKIPWGNLWRTGLKLYAGNRTFTELGDPRFDRSDLSNSIQLHNNIHRTTITLPPGESIDLVVYPNPIAPSDRYTGSEPMALKLKFGEELDCVYKNNTFLVLGSLRREMVEYYLRHVKATEVKKYKSKWKVYYYPYYSEQD